MRNPLEINEQQTEFLLGPGALTFYRRSFEPEVERMRKDLLSNLSLDEHTRRGYIIALANIKQGFSNAFATHKLSIPEWVESIV